MAVQKVAIVGGGIAGLTAAIALQQRGIQADVYESARRIRDVSAGIWVAPNGMQMLERLGLAELMSGPGVTLDSVEVMTRDGNVLAKTELDGLVEKYGWGVVSMHRATLHRLLLEEVHSAHLHLGKSVSRLDPQEGGVGLLFSDRSTAEADVVIAADGVRSDIRDEVLGIVSRRYAAQSWFRGIAHTRLSDEWRGRAREIWGGRRRFGFSNISEGKVYWYAATLEVDPDEPSVRRRDVPVKWRKFPEPVPQILEATDAERILRTEIYDIRPLESWWSGRTVLIGDAAHGATPNLSQGAAQAMEDGLALAACLDRFDAPEEAFRRFQEIRKPRADHVIRRARRLGRLAHLRNPITRAARDLVLRFTTNGIGQAQAENLFDVSYLDEL